MEINEFNRAVMDQEITHERAEEAALKIIAGAFNRNDKRPQLSIPPRKDDDDIILMEYLRRKKSPWRAIESAPKDGTAVVGCSTYKNKSGNLCYNWIADGYFDECGDWYFSYSDEDFEATHWMPLPEPPTVETHGQ